MAYSPLYVNTYSKVVKKVCAPGFLYSATSCSPLSTNWRKSGKTRNILCALQLCKLANYAREILITIGSFGGACINVVNLFYLIQFVLLYFSINYAFGDCEHPITWNMSCIRSHWRAVQTPILWQWVKLRVTHMFVKCTAAPKLNTAMILCGMIFVS